jgi:hypothetical protein
MRAKFLSGNDGCCWTKKLNRWKGEATFMQFNYVVSLSEQTVSLRCARHAKPLVAFFVFVCLSTSLFVCSESLRGVQTRPVQLPAIQVLLVVQFHAICLHSFHPNKPRYRHGLCTCTVRVTVWEFQPHSKTCTNPTVHRFWAWLNFEQQLKFVSRSCGEGYKVGQHRVSVSCWWLFLNFFQANLEK